MRIKTLILLTVILLSACNASSPTTTPSTDKPVLPSQTAPFVVNEESDIIFYNGVVLTMNAGQPAAQAVAVQGNRILAVGSNEEVLSLQNDHTQVIDLGGLTLMPGFVDAHSHLFGDNFLWEQDPLPDQQLAIEYGVTTTAEFYVDQALLDHLITLADAGKLQMRVNTYLLYTTSCGDLMGDWWKAYQPNQQIAPNLYVRGLKIFTDGGSCKIPAMSVDYPGGLGKGDLFFTQDQLNQIVAEVQAAGFQAAIHAAGDRALEQAQNAIAFALNGQPNTYRHRIEHNATIRPELLPRYSEIGIVPVIFGTYITCARTTGETKFKYLLSPEYGAWDWPWRALVDAAPDLPIAWQADYHVFGTINPLYHMWGMVTRQEVNTDGSICEPPDWVKAGALRIEEVLPMMTRNSAYALFFDNEVGTLQPGKFADMVILSDNPLTVESDSLKNIAVLMTMIGGQVEYCAAGSESLCPPAPPSDLEPGATSPASFSTVTTSAELLDSPASNAVDGNADTIWNSGGDPEQWIMIDLGDTISLSAIRLTVSQYPEGDTVHQIWVGTDPDSLTLLHEFSGFTNDGDLLEFVPVIPPTNIQFIKIITTQSPSWVAWREIEVEGH